MDRTAGSARRSKALRRTLVAVAAGIALVALPAPQPAAAAGLGFPVPMGQRFVGSASPSKAFLIPLRTQVGPIKPLALAGIESTTFAAIKDPLLGIEIFSSGEVKTIVRDTINGLGDDKSIGFKVNALQHPNTGEFTVGGNCIGADGNSVAGCVATVVFKPTSPGAKSDPIKADITLTLGLTDVENSLRAALDKNGIKGQIVNVLYPALRTSVQGSLNDGIESALLDPVAIASGSGVAGPFTDPSVFIRRQYADFAAGSPSAGQIDSWVKNFEGGGSPAGLIEALRTAKTWDGTVGPVSRLYSAYFLRAPDTSGLRFWVGRSRAGTRLYAISSTFAASSEFERRYGSLTDSEFVQLVYQNVLGRAPDSAGLAYWTGKLRNGSTRGRVMVGFSESSEYIRKQAANVAVIEIWFGMLQRAPSPAELSGFAQRIKDGTNPRVIITELLASTEYRSLVLG